MNYLEDSVLREDLQTILTFPGIDWHAFQGKTIAVTGATGLIGRLLVATFLEANKRLRLQLTVLAYVRNLEKANKLFEAFADCPLELCCHDICRLFPDKPADYLFHTAAVTASKTMVEQPVETIMAGVNGTYSALCYAHRQKMKSVVFLSSMEAYGITEKGQGYIRENDLGYINPLNVRSSYPEGKRLAECLCASFAKEYGVPVTIARLAATFGAGIDDSENRVYAQFARSVLNGKDIVLHTKGEKANCYSYTADTITALLILLQKGKPGESYNVANMNTFCTIREMAETFIRVSQSTASGLVIDIPNNSDALGYAPSSVMNLSSHKLMDLGWKPLFDMDSMAERLMASMWQRGQTRIDL